MKFSFIHLITLKKRGKSRETLSRKIVRTCLQAPTGFFSKRTRREIDVGGFCTPLHTHTPRLINKLAIIYLAVPIYGIATTVIFPRATEITNNNIHVGRSHVYVRDAAPNERSILSTFTLRDTRQLTV